MTWCYDCVGESDDAWNCQVQETALAHFVCDVNGKATKQEGALEFWQKMGFESANCYLKCPNFCPIPTKANKAKVKRIQELAPVVEQGVVELSEHF